ncbi:MAG: tyrosine-type recombinase/integrase [Pirellulales bacterium]|nr:tyrosine-type recombinase/integrase [Pirellulales bacterium]
MKKRSREPNRKKQGRTKKERRGKYHRSKQEVIDEDLGVVIFKYAPTVSPNWYVQYNHPEKGQIASSLRTRNFKEAKRKAGRIVSRLLQGEIDSPTRQGPKLKDAIELFVADKERRGRKQSTVTEYRRALLQFAQFCSRHRVTMLGSVTPELMQRYETELRTKGVPLPKEKKTRGRPPKPNNATSVHEKVKLVKSLAKFALSWDLISRNPIRGYNLPQDGKPNVHCYTPKEVADICGHAEPYFGDIFNFFAHTGLRQSELRWATKADFDAKRRVLLIRPKRFKTDNLSWDPKGDSRAVPLCDPAFAIAKRFAETTKGRWLFPAPWVPVAIDDRMRSCRLHSHLKKAKKAAGVERGVLHSFRHFFVSTMANANVSPFKVMKMVGHRSLDIILTYYHVDIEDLLETIIEVDFQIKIQIRRT